MSYSIIADFLRKKHPETGVDPSLESQTILNIWRGEKSPSLHISKAQDGELLWMDHGTSESGNGLKFLTEIVGVDIRTAWRVLGLDQIQKFDYVDENGKLLYSVTRQDMADGKKQIRQQDAKGRPSVKGCRRVPYHLPELMSAPVVYVAEGEKSVERLRDLGFVATTNSGGAGKWKPEFSQFLAGKDVVILPDNDDPGRAHAESVADSVSGTARSVKVVELPLKIEGEDVVEWLDLYGGTRDGLLELVAQTEAKVTPALLYPSAGNAYGNRPRLKGITHAELIGIDFPEKEWLIHGIIAKQSTSLLVGRSKIGKSRMCFELAQSLATGTPALGALPVKKCKVLYFALEYNDSRLADTLQGLGMFHPMNNLVLFFEAPPLDDRPGNFLEQLAEVLKEHPDAEAVFVDVLAKIKPMGRGNVNAYDQDYAVMGPLHRFALDHGIALVIVHHVRKSQGEDELDSISGSNGIGCAADGILMLKRARNSKEGTLYITGRTIDEQNLALKFTDNGNWLLIGDADEHAISKERREVLELLAVNDPMTPKEIAEELDRPHNNVKKMCFDMHNDRQLVRAGKGKYTVPQSEGPPNTIIGNLGDSILKASNGNGSSPVNGYFGPSNRRYPSNPVADSTAEAVTTVTDGYFRDNPTQSIAGPCVEADQVTGYCVVANEPFSDFVLIQDLESLAPHLPALRQADVLAIDTETTGLDPHTDAIRLVQIAVPDHPVLVLDLQALGQLPEAVAEVLAGPVIKLFHNAKFDLKMLRAAGIEVSGPFFDTMLASQLLSAGQRQGHGLADVCQRYLELELSKEQQVSDWTVNTLSAEQLAYAARDAAVLLPLMTVLQEHLAHENLSGAADLEFRCLPAVVEMELCGMGVDEVAALALISELQTQKSDSEAKLRALLEPSGISNLKSNTQLLAALQLLGVPVISTGKEALRPLAAQYPMVQALLDYRKASKMLELLSSMQAKVHPQTGRIHPTFWQIGAATGRFTCSKPNLQQVPKSLRQVILPDPGNALVSADYSQIELRVAASISTDPVMTQAYLDGRDLHALTASMMTGKVIAQITKDERQRAKAVNFGLLFGMGAAGLQEYAFNSYGVAMALEEAELYRKRFFAGYKGFKTWFNGQKRRLREEYHVRTASGRNRVWEHRPPLTEYVNSPIQGTAADILKLALSGLPEALTGTGAKIIGCVHDEILLECPVENAQMVADILKQTMEEAGSHYLTHVPVVAEPEILNNWAGV